MIKPNVPSDITSDLLRNKQRPFNLLNRLKLDFQNVDKRRERFLRDLDLKFPNLNKQDFIGEMNVSSKLNNGKELLPI